MKKFILIVVFGFLFSISASAQTTTPAVPCPSGYVCISQEAANRAAENARVRPLLEKENQTLRDGIEAERANTRQAQEVGRQNVETIRERLHKTEVEFATAKGQLTECQGERTRLIGTQEVLVKNARPKKIGLINLF